MPTDEPTAPDTIPPITLRLPATTLKGLAKLKAITGLSRNALVQHALKGYLSYAEKHNQLPPNTER